MQEMWPPSSDFIVLITKFKLCLCGNKVGFLLKTGTLSWRVESYYRQNYVIEIFSRQYLALDLLPFSQFFTLNVLG